MKLKIRVRELLCLFLGLFALFFTFGFKADRSIDKALTIGDSIPAIAPFPVLNYKFPAVKLSDFKDKLLVLDFWATTCGSCLEAMPSIAALQAQFKGRLQVIDVDYESRGHVAEYLANHPAKRALGLPVIAGDVLLKKMFPYQYLPRIVWIRNGVFIGATDGDYLTAANVERVLADGRFTFITTGPVNEPDHSAPLFLVSANNRKAANAGNVITSSVFTGAIPGALLNSGWDTTKGNTRFYAVNHPLLNLFAIALNSGLPFIANRRILDIRNPSLVLNLKHDYEDQWAVSHTYCAEIVVPGKDQKAEIKQLLLAEIRSSVGLTGVIAKREMDCLSLDMATDSSRSSHSIYPAKEMSFDEGKPVILHHIDLDDLAWLMNEHGMPPVLVDSDQHVVFDLELPALPNNGKAWKSTLAANGILLSSCKRQLDMFVLTDADHHLP